MFVWYWYWWRKRMVIQRPVLENKKTTPYLVLGPKTNEYIRSLAKTLMDPQKPALSPIKQWQWSWFSHVVRYTLTKRHSRWRTKLRATRHEMAKSETLYRNNLPWFSIDCCQQIEVICLFKDHVPTPATRNKLRNFWFRCRYRLQLWNTPGR